MRSVSGDRQNTNPSKPGGDESKSSQSKKSPAKKKGKAGSSKKMTAKEQSERFIEIARKLESDESGGAFDKVMRNVLTPRSKEARQD